MPDSGADQEPMPASVPTDPTRFFAKFLPGAYERIREQFVHYSSPGSFGIRIGMQAWSLRINDGSLEVTQSAEPDALMSLATSPGDFAALCSLIAEDDSASDFPSAPFMWDAETAALVRQLPGLIVVEIEQDAASFRLVIGPGSRSTPDHELSDSDCRVRCKMSDLVEVRRGKQSPMQLFLDGKLQLSGNVQIALALGGLLSR